MIWIASLILTLSLSARVAFLPAGLTVSKLVSSPTGDLYTAGMLNEIPILSRLSPDSAKVLYRYSLPKDCRISAIALDPAGALYAAGYTPSKNLPFTSRINAIPEIDDVQTFVLKLNSLGELQYFTLIGGKFNRPNSIAVNRAGEALIGADRDLYVIPDGGGLFPSSYFYANEQAILKLDANGANLLVTIFNAGAGLVAYDLQNNIYFAGRATGSTPVPISPGAFQTTHEVSICAGEQLFNVACRYQYLAKFNPDGTKLLYSTYLTGSYGADPVALAIDGAGNAIVVGTTKSPDYPTTPNTLQPTYSALAPPRRNSLFTRSIFAPAPSGYITKLNYNGTALLWSTFFSGTGSDSILSAKLDSSNNILLAGLSGSLDLPGAQLPAGCLTTANQTIPFVTKINPEATKVLSSQYLHGLDPDGHFLLLSDSLLFRGDSFTTFDSTTLACATDPADNAILNQVVPGQLLTFFGQDFSNPQVTFDGIPARILYADKQQVNIQVPNIPAFQQTVTAKVQSQSRAMRVIASNPSIFLNSAGSGQSPTCLGVTYFNANLPIATNQNGSLNSCNKPAPPQSTITLFLNGLSPIANDIDLEDWQLVSLEQDGGLWRLQVRPPGGATTGTLPLKINGNPLRTSAPLLFLAP